MRLSHRLARTSAVFDESNLVSSGGLVPALALADRAGLRELADEHLIVPTDKGGRCCITPAQASCSRDICAASKADANSSNATANRRFAGSPAATS
jgi:hypothetical protein